ncbi:TAT-variant-translocated molybdopterin oxidoreductase [Lichenicoccus roseus]|uniref:4Fe-4S dicluster domain-containing protein n=1 Tax=Lichenicoccus roseus TaxID=2683649 RepID=A0A5R9JAA9_9PROT|nr:TAT-variant-translocated molybdopterin oxidoreductase [Lichenicoccus roseus]TLU73477.1 4Fe-4S dicluster domain-containing protein [Lichenicoccus roseus]
MSREHPGLATLRGRLSAQHGALWRSLDQLDGNDAFRRFLHTEFPNASPGRGVDRRAFLRLMAASLSLAGLAGCDDPDDDPRSKEIPYVEQPREAHPGQVMRYASSTLIDGHANGVTVLTRDGRPIKIEGAPAHPWSRGGTDIAGQASVLDFWDPFRSQAVLRLGRPDDWDSLRPVIEALPRDGLHLLTGPVTSPSLLAQIRGLQQRFPGLRWHVHAPADAFAARTGAARAFGQPLDMLYDFSQARTVVSLDGDILDPGPRQVGLASRWAEARRASAARGTLLTLHAVAPTPTLTSSKADHLLVAAQSDIERLAHRLPDGGDDPWQKRVAQALANADGSTMVVAGAWQPVSVHEAVHRLNARLGNLGRTVLPIAPVAAQAEDLPALVQAMQRGQVRTLVMLDVNPVQDAPSSLGFAQALERVPMKLHAGLYADETAAACDWHIPLAHPLESWGDARAADGTIGLIQPTILPLYAGRTVPEILSLLTDAQPQDGQTLLRAYWRTRMGGNFDTAWHQALLQGFIADSQAGPVAVTSAPGGGSPTPPATPPGKVDVLFRPDPVLRDGAGANNAWLQELPKPLTRIVWDNAVLVSPTLGKELGIVAGDVLRLEADGRAVEGPAWIMPGQAARSVTLTLGYGRSNPDMLATGIGYDAALLRPVANSFHIPSASITRTGRRHQLVTTQDHNTMEGHDLVRVQQVGAAPVGDKADTADRLYGGRAASGSSPADTGTTATRAWGMVIDLDSCIGCNACVVSCQAENNIAVVGREQVAEGREMHWLRIDRYYEGDAASPATHFQPVPCMHCEDAPCEVGCPVEATVHDHEGLNVMVYNRCIGTRACSGYCPYKVRRFNYLDYSAGAAPQLAEQRNPDVTVRARGVMEKCTYCVQRIAEGRIDSDKTGNPISDGTVRTACQTACPTQAISFGDLADATSAVRAKRQDPRNYSLLGDLGVKPRTTYLAKYEPAAGPA